MVGQPPHRVGEGHAQVAWGDAQFLHGPGVVAVRLERGDPRPAIDELNKQMSEAVRSPAVQSFIAKQSLEAVTDTPEEFKSFFESEKLRWSDVIKTAGVKVN